MAKNPITQLKRTLGTDGVLLIVAAALMLELVSMMQYRYAKEEISVDLHLRAQSELLAKGLAIQNVMSQVESAVGNHVWDAERAIGHPDSSYAVVRRLVEQNPYIIGSSFSFEPNYYPSEGYWFESYAVRRDSGNIELMQLGSKEHDYTQAEFYKIPIQADSSRWTDPYLDSDGARMLLTTFSEPIHDKEGRPVAVLDADISLDWLKNILSVNYVYPSSYHILISRSGQIMSYPDNDYVMRKTIRDIADEKSDTTFRSISREMMSGKSGNAIFKDENGEKYHVFFAPVGGDTGWSLAVVSSEKEIFGKYNKMKENLIFLRIVALAILIFIIVRSIININKLQKITMERERIQSELKVAREIQMGMLPKNGTLIAVGEEIDIEGTVHPAKEVGGDLYDYFVKDDHLYFCIGDVSGKGVPASMFMTVTRSLFRTVSPYTKQASKVLEYMNRTMVNVNETNMFVTFLVGILNLKTGELNYSNAGHDGPIVIDPQGIRVLDVKPNLPLGVISEFNYKEQQVKLADNTVLFLYTDGLTEAKNGDHDEYGENRMLQTIGTIHDNDPDISMDGLLKKVTDSVAKFVDDADQSDDLTMLALRFKSLKATETVKKIMLKNDISSVKDLNRFVETLTQEVGISADVAMEIKLALEEIIVNVIEYAYPKGENGDIDLEFEIDTDKLTIFVRDRGKEFDPTKAGEVDTTASAEEREIGGLGIFLARQLTDKITYRREQGTNILTIEKNLSPSHNDKVNKQSL